MRAGGTAHGRVPLEVVLGRRAGSDAACDPVRLGPDETRGAGSVGGEDESDRCRSRVGVEPDPGVASDLDGVELEEAAVLGGGRGAHRYWAEDALIGWPE